MGALEIKLEKANEEREGAKREAQIAVEEASAAAQKEVAAAQAAAVAAEEAATREAESRRRETAEAEAALAAAEAEWTERLQQLESSLENALRTNYATAAVADMSRGQMEQELASLSAVVEMRTEEVHRLRASEADLRARLDGFHWTEQELGKAKNRVEEMSLVVQNKMVAEKELMEMTEQLTNDLAKARREILTLKRDLENRQYLRDNHVRRQNKGDGQIIILCVGVGAAWPIWQFGQLRREHVNSRPGTQGQQGPHRRRHGPAQEQSTPKGKVRIA